MKKFKQKIALVLILSASLMISACNTRTGAEIDGTSEGANEMSTSDSMEDKNTHKLTVPNKSSKDATDKSTKTTASKSDKPGLTERNNTKDSSENSNESENSQKLSNNSVNSEDSKASKSSSNSNLSNNEYNKNTEKPKDSLSSQNKYDFTGIKLGAKNFKLPFFTKDLIDLGYESTKAGELEQYSYALGVPFVNSEDSDDIVIVDIINLEEKARSVDSAPVYSITITNKGVFSDMELSNGVSFKSKEDDIIQAHANEFSDVARISSNNNETIIRFNSTENKDINIEYTLVDSELIKVKITTDKFLAPQ